MIEGTNLNVCPNCARYGESTPTPQRREEHPIVARRLEKRQKRMRTRDVFKETSPETLVLDYPDRIKRARERMNLSQKELGKAINEKWSVINKLETGDLRPSDTLVLKLEKKLDIKLREKVEDVHLKKQDETPTMTLADLLKEE